MFINLVSWTSAKTGKRLRRLYFSESGAADKAAALRAEGAERVRITRHRRCRKCRGR